MKKIKFKIDEKSLYHGVFNDYVKGQSATVHTPINQSKHPEKWRNDILELTKLNIETKQLPDMLLEKCLSKTTSDASSKINYLFEFKKILYDGKPLKNNTNSFAMYIKEEVDEFIKRRSGKVDRNTHLGRMKLHYLKTLKFKSDGFIIDNNEILNQILQENGGFAFVVRGFEYSIEDKTLNFLTSMIGPQGVLLSNVFKRGKGTGKKLLLSEVIADDFDFVNETILLAKQKGITDIQTAFELANKTKVENGKLGEKIVYELLSQDSDLKELYHTSLDYPTSPYDIECLKNNEKLYIEIKSTQGTKLIFNMSIGEKKFMEKYKENYILYLITEVKSAMPNIYKYYYDNIKGFRYEYPTTRYYAESKK